MLGEETNELRPAPFFHFQLYCPNLSYWRRWTQCGRVHIRRGSLLAGAGRHQVHRETQRSGWAPSGSGLLNVQSHCSRICSLHRSQARLCSWRCGGRGSGRKRWRGEHRCGRCSLEHKRKQRRSWPARRDFKSSNIKINMLKILVDHTWGRQMPPFWHKRLQLSDPSVELKAAQSVPGKSTLWAPVDNVSNQAGMRENYLDSGLSNLWDIWAVEIFGIWHKVCPVLCIISCRTIGSRVMGGRQSVGEQDRGGQCIIHSASRLSHVWGLSLACPALAILLYPPISYHPLPFFLIDPPLISYFLYLCSQPINDIHPGRLSLKLSMIHYLPHYNIYFARLHIYSIHLPISE